MLLTLCQTGIKHSRGVSLTDGCSADMLLAGALHCTFSKQFQNKRELSHSHTCCVHLSACMSYMFVTPIALHLKMYLHRDISRFLSNTTGEYNAASPQRIDMWSFIFLPPPNLSPLYDKRGGA